MQICGILKPLFQIQIFTPGSEGSKVDCERERGVVKDRWQNLQQRQSHPSQGLYLQTSRLCRAR